MTGRISLRSGKADILSVDINSLLKLFDETFKFQYDPTTGNLTKIIINTKDADGNPKTITLTLTYDAQGNLTSIDKEVT